MNVVVVARDPARRQALTHRVEEAGWTVRADVPTEAALSPEDLDGVAAVLIDARDTHVTNRSDEAQDLTEPLTAREHEVLEQMAQGRNNAGIAAALFLSPHAVEKHINSLFSKLGLSQEADVHRRVKAVLLFLAEQSP